MTAPIKILERLAAISAHHRDQRDAHSLELADLADEVTRLARRVYGLSEAEAEPLEDVILDGRDLKEAVQVVLRRRSMRG